MQKQEISHKEIVKYKKTNYIASILFDQLFK